ncbi:uncharacterized protein [Periplaneta americana]|uniref:uncharacterized protein n=1 Tax=Periplaneta americana TaxID=6978 RepID=UPI0037E71467
MIRHVIFFLVVVTLWDQVFLKEREDPQLKQAKRMIKNVCKAKCSVKPEELANAAVCKFSKDQELAKYLCCVGGLLQCYKGDEFCPDQGLENIEKLPEAYRPSLKKAVQECRGGVKVGKPCNETSIPFFECVCNSMTAEKFCKIFPS